MLPNGRIDVHQAADPKVYFDKRLGESGAWVMLYFGYDARLLLGIWVAFLQERQQ